MTKARGHCSHCGDVIVEVDKVNHILHLILTVITYGLWLVIWLFVANNPTSQCTKCARYTSIK
jgi:hypothetical protein